MIDDPKYTSALRRDAPKSRYQVMYAADNDGVAILNSRGELAAAFSNPKDAADWMQERLDEFQKEELAA